VQYKNLETNNGIIDIVDNTSIAYTGFVIKNQFLVGPESVSSAFECINILWTDHLRW